MPALVDEVGAQSVDTARTITLPAPESGVIYIRSGTPGGVRIRSRYGTNPASSVPRRPVGQASSLTDPLGTFDPADLLRLEALLARQGLDLDVGLARRGDEVVVVLRPRSGGLPTDADTLSVAEAARLLDSFGGRATPGEAGPSDVPPLVTRIERSILEAGLFRSLQVNFEFDRSELLSTAEPTLDAVATVLERFPDLRIEVSGHTDSVGPDAYNRSLSARRAEEVRRALIDRGIRPDRIQARGYGEGRPVLSNRSSTGRALNRRVEFLLLNPEVAEQYPMNRRENPGDGLDALRRSIREGVRAAFDESRY